MAHLPKHRMGARKDLRPLGRPGRLHDPAAPSRLANTAPNEKTHPMDESQPKVAHHRIPSPNRRRQARPRKLLPAERSLMRGLNAREVLFAQEIVKGATGRDAYKAAGYKLTNDNTMDVCASQLLRRPKVAAYIQELQGRAATRAEISVVYLTEKVLALASQPKTSHRTRRPSKPPCFLHGGGQTQRPHHRSNNPRERERPCRPYARRDPGPHPSAGGIWAWNC